MKKHFKLLAGTIALLIGMGVLYFTITPALKVQALGIPQSLFINSSNSVAGTSTNTPNSVIDCTGGKELTIGVTSQFIAAGVSNVTFYFEKSLDGSNFEPSPSFNYAFQGNGTNVITGVTNFTLNACPFVRLSHVANANVSFPTTNTSIRVFVK